MKSKISNSAIATGSLNAALIATFSSFLDTEINNIRICFGN